MAHDAAVQQLFKAKELVHLAFHQAGHRNSRPAADHQRDVLFVDLFLEQSALPLFLGEVRFLGGELPFQPGQFAVAQLGDAVEIVRPLRLLDLLLGLFDLLPDLAEAADGVFLGLPLGLERVELSSLLGQLLLQRLQPSPAALVGLLAEGLALDLQLHHFARHFVQFSGQAVDLGPKTSRRLIHQIDRLVGQKPVADVPVREPRSGHQRGILDPHAVVHLVPFFQAPQDRDRVLDRRLVHEDGLEAPFERRILLDVLAILVQRGGADHVQFASGQHRLEEVRGIHGAFGRPGSDHRVQLVDEQEHLTFGRLDFLQDSLEALFKLASKFGSGHQRAHVQHDQPLLFEAFRDVSLHDSLGQPLHDRGLADAGLTDEDRVVLGAPGQDLNHAADLLVASDDGIELPLSCQPGEVPPVFFQRLVGALRVLAGHALVAADLLERGQKPIAGQPQTSQDAALLRHRQQNVLDAQVFISESPHLLLGTGQHLREARREVDLSGSCPGPLDLRDLGQRLFQGATHGCDRDARLFKQWSGQPFCLLHQGQQQMLHFDALMTASHRVGRRGL